MTDWLSESIDKINEHDLQNAWQKQNQLTKPQGSLGLLEDIAVTISALQKTATPDIGQAQIIIYAADHGIAQENVSAFPQAVTAEMIKNFSAGGAAISVLSRQHKLPLNVINMGVVSELPVMNGVEHKPVASGTQSFLKQQAMDKEQLSRVFEVVKNKIDQLTQHNCRLLIPGEMGIANTTSATAMACALQGIEPEELTGKGTGLDESGLGHKIQIIKQALDFHKETSGSPLEILQTFGGFEIAALTATYIRCAQQGIICLVDGFICSVAALFAIRINQDCQPWLIFSHQSAEQGHKKILEVIQVKPLLQFNMRLGEGSGAALVYPLIQSACLLHNEMASFASASISEVKVSEKKLSEKN